jgi:hypothetical protein
MQAKQAPPRLPGVRASVRLLVPGIVGGLTLIFFVPLTALLVLASIGLQRGHLPWPLVQWAVTTPIGLLTLIAAGVVIVALPFVAVMRRIWAWNLARAVDVTGLPPWVWPKRLPLRPGETHADRWLGRGRLARRVTVAMLVASATFFLLVLAGVIASAGWSYVEIDSITCGAQGCPPLYPVGFIALDSLVATNVLIFLALYRWLRRVEASGGVSLRYPYRFEGGILCYVRAPGVTHETAAAALARFTPRQEVPVARLFAVGALAFVPALLMAGAAFFLSTWLQLQWISG